MPASAEMLPLQIKQMEDQTTVGLTIVEETNI